LSTNKFFRKSDWIACIITFLVSLVVYTLTLAPTVTLEDSGELIVASDYLGVPHPPGYPIWSLLTWFFQWIFHAVKYNGHPNPAWAVNWFSAFSGAAACGIIALLISRSGMDLLRSIKKESETLGEATENLFCAAAGIAGGLLLAFGQGMWSQSVIAEVYSLNIFFQSLVLLFLYRWISDPKQPVWLILCAFTFGLGTTNHQTLMFMGMAIAIAILFRDFKQFRDFAITGALLLIMIVFNKFGADKPDLQEWLWLAGPEHKGFWIWTGYALIIPIIALFTLPNGKTVGYTLLAMEIGIAFYLYMPFSSDQNPPINWGYPRTWHGFIHAITRGQYERVVLSDIFGNPGQFIMQSRAFFRDLSSQYYLPLVMIGFLPFTAWRLKVGRFSINGILTAIAILIPAALGIIIEEFSGIRAAGLIAGYLMFILFLLTGLGFGLTIVNFIETICTRVSAVVKQGKAWDWIEILVLAGVIAIVTVGMSLFGITLAGALAGTAKLNDSWVNLAIFFWITLPPTLLIAAFALKKLPSKLEFDVDATGQHWFITTIVAFISVGLVFVVLQNPKTDIQTLFIGRVQYIQSHAIYAIWLGYGLLFGVTYVESLFKNNKLLRIVMTATLVLMPAVLILKNYYDPHQIDTVGGSEQNGHDFGWQFGNWQLQGVKGIKADLQAWHSPEEFERIWAEYPNPNYPEPMGTNAIFFGGTDPGRFVPTYMIYCAKVRPDVYLITQNALADNTYMDVMRDLYGDQIWIPGPADSARAFQEYYQGVQSGQIDAGANVTSEGGRVQVQGVAGVMKINGILSKMIFDHNQFITETPTDEKTRSPGSAVVARKPDTSLNPAEREKRTFYVEESYVLPWMYPYLTPHGLIMKINNEPTPLTAEMIKNDTDFWNWYVKRLISDEKFIRDIVARKTFSKLRSALAGLYANKGRFKEAEEAFRQSVALYDLSPEANFRLADLLAKQARYDEAIAIMEIFTAKDTQNDRAQGFRNDLINLKQMAIQCEKLEALAQTGKIDGNSALELLKLYIQMGRLQHADQLALSLINNNSSSNSDMILQLAAGMTQAKRYHVVKVALDKYQPVTGNRSQYELLMQIAQQLLQGQQLPVVELALSKGVQVDPQNWMAWLNLAAFQGALNKQGEMYTSLQLAIENGGEVARNAVRKDDRFNNYRNQPEFLKLVPPPANFNRLLPAGAFPMGK
jgi:tetratricopeptide (TPR) repeat protein